jgi:hypothetical protein
MNIKFIAVAVIFISSSILAKWWCFHPQKPVAKGPYDTRQEAIDVCSFNGTMGSIKEGGIFPPADIWKTRESV